VEAAEALRSSLNEDEIQMRVAGVTPDLGLRIQTEKRLLEMFDHYASTSQPLSNLTRLEEEILVPVPAKGSPRASTRYRFQCFIDGWTIDPDGRPWLVEFKLRRRLSAAHLIQADRQLRWYSWALKTSKGIEPVGVIVDERLNQVPKPARVIRGRKGEPTASHASDQLCTVDEYRAACEHFGVVPLQETLRALANRAWQQRTTIMFRESELKEAGRELTSAAQLIRQLDSRLLAPIRNVSAQTCNSCRFQPICAHPQDTLYVDSLFERTVPKRERPPEERNGLEIRAAA